MGAQWEGSAVALEQIFRRLDDLDGSELDLDSTPVSFALEGVQYSIDLTRGNTEKLREALAPFIAAARTEGFENARHLTRSQRTMKRRAIREWARANNLEVSDRGRISDAVLDAYASQGTSSRQQHYGAA
ncbi:Lsr2 family protein [uncultured Microbacterium sp.]|uniref:histone-like nucleoid-structuring protein Lsr2 n=1 Tax=uncultured Microbacterium sp. TaxID=191216 RepID=UPI0028D7FB1D|nr:Lsr2 family protein [uncultured Microbacterium sp.]